MSLGPQLLCPAQAPSGPTGPVLLFLDTFTAVDGTDPLTRDIDVHPAVLARWNSGYGAPTIIGNELHITVLE